MFIQFFPLFFSDLNLKHFNLDQGYVPPAVRIVPQCGIDTQMLCQSWGADFSIEITVGSNFQRNFVKSLLNEFSYKKKDVSYTLFGFLRILS